MTKRRRPPAVRRRSAVALVAAALVLTAALLGVACGGDDEEIPAEAAPAVESAPPPAEPAPEPASEPAPLTPEPSTPEAAAPTSAEGSAPPPATPSAPPAASPGWALFSPPGDFWAITAGEGGAVLLASSRGSGLLSFDGGRNWNAVDWPGDARLRAAVSSNGLYILVAGIGALAGFDYTAVWSTDAGLTWTDSGRSVQAVVAQAQALFLAAGSPDGLFSTSDGGASGPVLIPKSDPNFDPVDIAVNPRNPDDIVLLSVSEGGTFRLDHTPDRGATVAALDLGVGLFGGTKVAFLPVGYMVMSQSAGVLFSFDGGATWAVQNQGLETLQRDGFFDTFVDLVVLPDSNVPVLATRDGLYRFDPGGWEALGGPGAEIRAITVLPGPQLAILAATPAGVFRLDLP